MREEVVSYEEADVVVKQVMEQLWEDVKKEKTLWQHTALNTENQDIKENDQ